MDFYSVKKHLKYLTLPHLLDTHLTSILNILGWSARGQAYDTPVNIVFYHLILSLSLFVA